MSAQPVVAHPLQRKSLGPLALGALCLVAVSASAAPQSAPFSQTKANAGGESTSASTESGAAQSFTPSATLLELQVTQYDPGLPWRYELINQGEGPIRISADPRLLWFEVQVPGKKKRQTCRLPKEIFPERVDQDFTLILRPGERFGQHFDPRLYCFAAGGQTELVAGALVYPRFGWPKNIVTSWKNGKRVTEEKLEAPFSATPPLPRSGSASHGKPAVKIPVRKDTHLKLVEGAPVALKSAYASWSSAALSSEAPSEDSPQVLAGWESPRPSLTMTGGSDAAAERVATIQVRLSNPSKREKLSVYFRRELLSFEVIGPDGLVRCEPEPRTRYPQAQAFTNLGPGKSIQLTSRLTELCPRGTFNRPGLYLIRARFDSKEDGADFGLNAFTGRLIAEQPATVRIRNGDKKFRAASLR